jgi:ABC-type multidrug transport system fused ATPase/permease subunit
VSDYSVDENNPRSRNYKGPRASLRDLLPYLQEHRRALAFAIALSIFASALALAQPLLIGQIISVVESGSELGWLLYAVVFVLITSGLVNGFQYYLLYRTGEGVVLTTRKALVARLLRLPIWQYDRRRTGDLVSRVGSDSTLLRAVLTQGLVDVAGNLLVFVGAVIAMAFIDPLLLVITLSVVTLAVFAITLAGRRIRQATTLSQVKVGAMSASVERALSAIRTIRAARAEERETQAIYRDAEAAFEQGKRIAKLSAAVTPIAQIAINASLITVIGLGGYRVATGETTIASLVTFIILLFFIIGPLISAFGAYNSVMSALGALARIQEIMRLDPEEQAGAVLRQAQSTTAIEFDRVEFAYPEEESEATAALGEAEGEPESEASAEENAQPAGVLSSVSFQIERGSRVALVGPSGAGKSTIFALIERFYDPTAGRILLDGQDVTEFSRASLREQIGYVEQDAPVLAGSIRDNLLLGSPDATDDQLREVLEKVNLTAVLERDPRGLDSEVGENGIMLSGGERQRLAIARALLAAPPILLLDESTSALDGPNEQRMREALDAVAENRTLVVIAHRLSTVVDSDKIIVLENGRVVGAGTHSELVKSTPLYAELAKHQLLV